jgi:hypothetical protein
MDSASICAVCAWKATCKKKFSMSGRDISCPDYTKDVNVGEKKTTKDKQETPKKEN